MNFDQALDLLDAKRYRALEGFVEGKDRKQIQEDIDRSPSGLQHYVNDLREEGYLTGDDEPTPLGEAAYQAFAQAEESLEDRQEEVMQGIVEDMWRRKEEYGVSDEEFQQMLYDMAEEHHPDLAEEWQG